LDVEKERSERVLRDVLDWPSRRAGLEASRGSTPRDFFWLDGAVSRRTGSRQPVAASYSPEAMMLYLTEILELPVYDASGKKIGRVAEVAAASVNQPPRVTLLLLKNGKDALTRSVPFEDVSSLSVDAVRLRISGEQVQSFQPDESLLLLRKDLLDQQIIDVNGRKVVRINDLSLEERTADSRPELRIHAVDIGLEYRHVRLVPQAHDRHVACDRRLRLRVVDGGKRPGLGSDQAGRPRGRRRLRGRHGRSLHPRRRQGSPGGCYAG